VSTFAGELQRAEARYALAARLSWESMMTRPTHPEGSIAAISSACTRTNNYAVRGVAVVAQLGATQPREGQADAREVPIALISVKH
jgi:hypothetical protein